MKIKSFLAKPFAGYVHKQIIKGMGTALVDQQSIFEYLMKAGAKTEFGKEHGFSDIQSYQDFIRQVPIRDYEAFVPYIEKIKQGKHNVLWKGQPLYFAKTSGTTSGVKYIPISKDSISNHINTARNGGDTHWSIKWNRQPSYSKLFAIQSNALLRNELCRGVGSEIGQNR